MALHLPSAPLKTALCWSRYRDANPVPTSSLADDIATAPSGPVLVQKRKQAFIVRDTRLLGSTAGQYILTVVTTKPCLYVL